MKVNKQPKKFDCSKCPEYKTCKKLCDKAQKYANQDFVYLKEISKPSPEGETPWASTEKAAPTMTDREIIISTLLLCKVPRETIRKVLRIRPYTLRKIIWTINKKIRK